MAAATKARTSKDGNANSSSTSYPISLAPNHASSSSSSSSRAGVYALQFPFLPSLTMTKNTAPHYGILHSPASTSTSTASSSSAPPHQHLLEFPPRGTAPASAQAAHIYNVQSSIPVPTDTLSETTAAAARGPPPNGYSDVLLVWSEARQAYILEPVQSTLLLRLEKARRAAGTRAKELLSRLPDSTTEDGLAAQEEQVARGVKRRRLSRLGAKEEGKDLPLRRAPGDTLRSDDVAEDALALPLSRSSGDRDRTKAQTPIMHSSQRRAASPAQPVEHPSTSRAVEARGLASPVGLGLTTTQVDGDDDDDEAARALELEFEAAMDTDDFKASAATTTVKSHSPSSPPQAHSPTKLDLQQSLVTPLTPTLTKASSTGGVTSTSAGAGAGAPTTAASAVTSPPPPSSSSVSLAGATQGSSTSANRWKASWQPMAYSGSNAGNGQPSQYDDDDDDDEEEDDEDDEEEDDDDEEEEEAEGGSEDLDEFARLLEEELAGAGD